MKHGLEQLCATEHGDRNPYDKASEQKNHRGGPVYTVREVSRITAYHFQTVGKHIHSEMLQSYGSVGKFLLDCGEINNYFDLHVIG